MTLPDPHATVYRVSRDVGIGLLFCIPLFIIGLVILLIGVTNTAY